MAELIDKWKVVDKLTALENEFQHYKPFHGFEHAMYRKLVEVEMEIGKMVAVEAEPVVHARWKEYRDYFTKRQIGWICTNCSVVVDDLSNGDTPRCPHCGAHMDEEVSE